MSQEIIKQKFGAISEQLKNGLVPPKETVRTILGWYGVTRRGYYVSTTVKEELDRHQIYTEPDFDSAYIDADITFLKATKRAPDEEGLIDPTHRVIRLASANKPPLYVTPEGTLQQVITLMLSHDYSQLPVMSSTREVKGMVSWKSIGSRLALKRNCNLAKDCMEPVKEIGVDESIYSAIGIISECDFVLVRGKDKQICGIVTASDLTEQFKILAEPFLLVGEIENGIRRILHGHYTKDELSTVKDPADTNRNVEAVSDLTFGEYIRLIEPESNWNKLQLAVDRVEFIKQLQKIREIRNDVMHYDPDGLDKEDIKLLYEFSRFLNRLRDAGAA